MTTAVGLAVFCAFSALDLAAAGLIGSTQAAGAKGKLTCHGKPAANVLIKLYDDDRGQFRSPYADSMVVCGRSGKSVGTIGKMYCINCCGQHK